MEFNTENSLKSEYLSGILSQLGVCLGEPSLNARRTSVAGTTRAMLEQVGKCTFSRRLMSEAPDSRVSCRACRYRACLTAGMTADSIRSATTRTATTEPSVTSRKSQEKDAVLAHIQPQIANYAYAAPSNTDVRNICEPETKKSDELPKFVTRLRHFHSLFPAIVQTFSADNGRTGKRLLNMVSHALASNILRAARHAGN